MSFTHHDLFRGEILRGGGVHVNTIPVEQASAVMDPSGLKPLYYVIVRFWYVLAFHSHIAEKMDFKWDNSYNRF